MSGEEFDEVREDATLAEFDEHELVRAKLRGAQGNVLSALKAVEAAQVAAARGREMLAEAQRKLAAFDGLDEELTEILADDVGAGRLHQVPQSMLDRQAAKATAALTLRTCEQVFARHAASLADAQEHVKRAERVRDGRAIEVLALEVAPIVGKVVSL